jgi:predicted alpha/beta-hydrolase family hydrolase
MTDTFSLELSTGHTVSALLTEALDPFAVLVLAHGAGAGMRHRFMAAMAESLGRTGVSVLRYQFPYMEAGSKRPDAPAVAHAAVRSAVGAARNHAGTLPLFAGGKSFGARMTSQAQAADPLPGVRGLVFFGFPLHPAGKPSLERARHLADVSVPMVFLQGTNDALADIGLLEGVVSRIGPTATLLTTPDADHSFHVPARSGTTDQHGLEEIVRRAADWMRAVAARSGATTRP